MSQLNPARYKRDHNSRTSVVAVASKVGLTLKKLMMKIITLTERRKTMCISTDAKYLIIANTHSRCLNKNRKDFLYLPDTI